MTSSIKTNMVLDLTEDIHKDMAQVDLVLLDFCKGFDKVPHKCSLNILRYGIHSDKL